MFIPIDKIQTASHILLTVRGDNFANASVIYSYILTQHKKVSISYKEVIENKLSFLPWFSKLKEVAPSSADFVLDVTNDTKNLFLFLKENKVKINQKMATALYAGVLKQYDFFTSKQCDGTIFAIASELISLKAEYKTCHDYLQKRVSLSSLRLKTILLKSLLLKDDATKAYLSICDEDMKTSGATLEDAYQIMREVLNLVNVSEVLLVKTDENSKIIKNLKEI